jgi:hypothetical protein
MSYFFLGGSLGDGKELVVVGELGHAGQEERRFIMLPYDVTQYLSTQAVVAGAQMLRAPPLPYPPEAR